MPQDYVRRIRVEQSAIMVPIDHQGQAIIIVVRETDDMLVSQASATIVAGGSGNVDITVPSGELWEIWHTNHYGSGADISLDALYLSPDGGTTFYQLSTAHLDGKPIWVSGGNVIRASYSNAGASDETAYLTVIGRKLKTTV